MLLVELRCRRRGGVILRLPLLLRVSRRSSRSRPLRVPVPVSTLSSSSRGIPALPSGDLARRDWLTGGEIETDLERDLELWRLRFLRFLGGGEGLIGSDVDLLRFSGLGERDREVSEGMGDLRRIPRSRLLPLPLPPIPL